MRAWQGCQIKRALSAYSGDANDGSSSASVLALQVLLQQIKKFYPPLIREDAIGLLRHLDQLFITHPPDVKGVWLAGGVMTHGSTDRHFSVTGMGYSPADSLPGLIGEIAEAIALSHESIDGSDDTAGVIEFAELKSTALTLLAGLREFQQGSDRQLLLKHLATGAITQFPELLCRGQIAMPDSLPPLSEGCAAHVNLDAALLSALCEKVERDAIAHWWFAAKPPGRLTADDEKSFDAYYAACQRVEGRRSCVLLNISHRSWAPSVFAVVSFDSQDGTGLAMGFGCGLSSDRAIGRALLEVHQMEMALSLAMRRRQQRQSLSSKDKAVIQRAEQIDMHQSNLLVANREPPAVRQWSQSNAVATIAADALQAGVDLFYSQLDVEEILLTVVKVISPQLESPIRGIGGNLNTIRMSTKDINPL